MKRTAFEFNGVVRLTELGTGYVVLTLLIGFAALNTGNNSLYITLAFMLGTLLISGIASKGGLKHLHVRLAPIGDAWAGRPARGEIEITNGSPLWSVRDLIIAAPQLEAPLGVPLIQKRGAMSVPATFFFERRGLMHVQSIDLYTRYPFGFFLKKRRVPAALEVVVYPRLLEGVVDHQFAFKSEGDAAPGRRAGWGNDVHGFRDYVRGDSLRQVHWKKSASIGRWITKQAELEADRVIRVAVDPYCPMQLREKEFEELISAAATYLQQGAEHDSELSLRVPGKRLTSTGLSEAGAMFRELALMTATTDEWTESFETGTTLFTLRDHAGYRTA
ncbi:MAG TPA: DUF58 domain-containing protein [Thermoanaerobaculia bacterium]|nr:DUF58 domain-containing protein [Thermoanaerobaculia bacterium]